jgi:hypothetical protein
MAELVSMLILWHSFAVFPPFSGHRMAKCALRGILWNWLAEMGKPEFAFGDVALWKGFWRGMVLNARGFRAL